MLAVDIEEAHQGAIMEALGARRGDLQDMQPDGKGRVRLDYRIPARGLIGFQSEFLTTTRGTGIMSHVFDDYGPMKPEISERRNGVMISAENGEAVAYALWKLQERGRMFVNPGEPLYEGMVVGLHSRDNDLVVNPVRTKQLTNIRAAGKDEAILLTPPIRHTLESAVEFIADDELVEITPHVDPHSQAALERARKKARAEGGAGSRRLKRRYAPRPRSPGHANMAPPCSRSSAATRPACGPPTGLRRWSKWRARG